MRWILTIGLAVVVAGCAHSPQVADSVPRESITEVRSDVRLEVLDAIVAHWVRANQDRKIFRYIDPELCALPMVAKLRREGFVIYSKAEARPPRNSWDTDETRTWYELKIGEIKIGADGATAEVKTIWNGGFELEEYSLSKDSGRWFVARAETLIIT
jgi:hypothetical protein